MRKVLFIILFVAIGLTSIDATGADWKFCGGATLFKGEKTIAFYDSESVEHTSGGTSRVWVKAIRRSEFDAVMKENEKDVIEKSAKKVVNKYYPPYALANQKTSFDDYIDIISWEELANSYEIKTRSKFLFEINCADKKLRILSGVSYKDSGEIDSSAKIGDWDYISPESNAEILQKILCN
jgi:hypothetical protein